MKVKINQHRNRICHSRKSGNPGRCWIPGQARNDKQYNAYVVMYNFKKLQYFLFCLLLFTIHCSLFTVLGCGYHIVGSKPLPFSSVTIEAINNKTYEPGIEERFHNALSKEFIVQGIKVLAINGDVVLKATVTTFELGALAYVDEKVKEQTIILKVDVSIIDKERVINLGSMQSPIQITFRSTGTVSESASQKEMATDRVCVEIAKEIISKIILRYAE